MRKKSRRGPILLVASSYHSMKICLLLWLTGLTSTSLLSTLAFPMSKPGCNETCPGSAVTIPYPFGIGSPCALNEWYNVSCQIPADGNSLKPFITIDGDENEVIKVSLKDQTVTIADTSDNQTACYTDADPSSGLLSYSYGSINLSGSPFFFSKYHNKLALKGCGTALLLDQNHQIAGQRSQVLSGCTSTCRLTSSNLDGCFGMNCCETNIPFYLKQYQLNFSVTEAANDASTVCATAVLVDQRWHAENFSDPLFQFHEWPDNFSTDPVVPVVLTWTLQNPSDTSAIVGCSRKISSLDVESGNITNYGCECKSFRALTWFYEINPYLDGACQYAHSVIIERKKNTKDAIIGATVGIGMLVLVTTIYTMYQLAKRRHNNKRKEKYFKRNGGLLLQQQLSTDQEEVVKKIKMFTAKELNKASDGFNANRILGEGGQGTVYKGMLTDGRIVAIKKSKKVDENQLEQFINEVVILSEVNHRNVVKLLGCCLESEVPLLVYEFIPNGTLFSLIHNASVEEFPLTWNFRLRIAREVASALAYLHSAISIPIFHRDIKSSNILLGEKYIAKVSDFGTSKSVAIDKTHLTTRVQGTIGYLDPEYFQSSQFTEKSDVYSFGVVLVELLTRQKPITAPMGDECLSLATRFLTAMDENSLPTIIDPELTAASQSIEEEVLAVANLAQKCLNLNGKKRPTMKEVAYGLESIRPVDQESFQAPSITAIDENSVAFFDWITHSITKDSIYWPTFIVATLAAIVASQATISAAFSIIKQVYRVPEDERFLVKRIGPKNFHMFRCVAGYGYKDLHKRDDDFEKKLFENLFLFVRLESMMEGSSDSDEYSLYGQQTQPSSDFVLKDNTKTVSSIAEHTISSVDSIVPVKSPPMNASNTMLSGQASSQTEMDELEFLNSCSDAGVVHILGNTIVRARRDSKVYKRVAIDYIYAFLRKICRVNSVMFRVPHESLLNVGQIFFV